MNFFTKNEFSIRRKLLFSNFLMIIERLKEIRVKEMAFSAICVVCTEKFIENSRHKKNRMTEVRDILGSLTVFAKGDQ